MRTMTTVVVLTLCGFAARPARARQAPARVEVFVLGVYHMANPGHDIFNLQVDDVLAPQRQAEIMQVMGVLQKFQPTKIALERNAGDKRIVADYADYLAGKHELTRNEIEQLGFRLAKALGHSTVYPVDADGDFPYPRLVKFAKATGRSAELDSIMGGFGATAKAQDSLLARGTILGTLRYMNSDDVSAQNVQLYYRLAHFGEPSDWAGADLLADWFRRNLRIFSNVAQLADRPSERLLVIIGAGHLPWLQLAFGSDPTFRVRKLAEFAN
jgi:hypothetical protein